MYKTIKTGEIMHTIRYSWHGIAGDYLRNSSDILNIKKMMKPRVAAAKIKRIRDEYEAA